MDDTFVYAWRSLRNHWLWRDTPFKRGQAWIDMIMRASYVTHQFFIDGKPIEQKRGQFITSIRDLADTWGWSRTKVDRFLTVLKADQMIDYEKVQKRYTSISILNYDLYQSYEIEGATESPEQVPAKEPEKDIRKTSERHQKSPINKEYKENKENSIVTHIMKLYSTHTKDIRPWDRAKAEDFLSQHPKLASKLENAVQLEANWGKEMADIIESLRPKQVKPQDFVPDRGKIVDCPMCGYSKNERDEVCPTCKGDEVRAKELRGIREGKI